MDSTSQYIGIFIASWYFIGGFGLLYFSARDAIASEEAGTLQGVMMSPVGIFKFLILATVTSGLYSLYWFWRCWRRYFFAENVIISPFWRMFFPVIWFYPLFRAARDKSPQKWPLWLGVACTIVYLIGSVIVTLGLSGSEPQWQIEIVAFISTLTIVPIIQMVNAANTPETVNEASGMKGRDWLAIMFGFPVWITLVLDLLS